MAAAKLKILLCIWIALMPQKETTVLPSAAGVNFLFLNGAVNRQLIFELAQLSLFVAYRDVAEVPWVCGLGIFLKVFNQSVSTSHMAERCNSVWQIQCGVLSSVGDAHVNSLGRLFVSSFNLWPYSVNSKRLGFANKDNSCAPEVAAKQFLCFTNAYTFSLLMPSSFLQFPYQPPTELPVGPPLLSSVSLLLLRGLFFCDGSFHSWFIDSSSCQTEALLHLIVPHYHFIVPQRPQLWVTWGLHGGTQRPFAFPFHAQPLGLLQLEVSTPLKTYFQVLKGFNQQQKWFQPSREVNVAALLSWFLLWLPLASWAFSTPHQVCLAWPSPSGVHHHLHPCCQHRACHHSKLWLR